MRAALAFKGWILTSSLLLTVKGSAPAVWFRLAGTSVQLSKHMSSGKRWCGMYVQYR